MNIIYHKAKYYLELCLLQSQESENPIQPAVKVIFLSGQTRNVKVPFLLISGTHSFEPPTQYNWLQLYYAYWDLLFHDPPTTFFRSLRAFMDMLKIFQI